MQYLKNFVLLVIIMWTMFLLFAASSLAMINMVLG